MRPFVAAALKIAEGFEMLTDKAVIESAIRYKTGQPMLPFTASEQADHLEAIALAHEALAILNGPDEDAACRQAMEILDDLTGAMG